MKRLVLVLLALVVVGGLAFMVASSRSSSGSSDRVVIADGGTRDAPATRAGGQAALGPLPTAVDLSSPVDKVKLRFGKMPKGGLLVNLDTGEVLWRHHPERTRPIASLTKMMTGLVAVDELRASDKARITKSVLAYSGSGVGVLPRNKRVKVETLLYGLMLPSGNDAARALAFRATGSLTKYVDAMNEKAGQMGLRCTQFGSIEGLSDKNRSCPADLAVLAKAVLDTPRLAKIVKARRAVLPFPIKGGRIHLYNNNPLLRQGYPGVLGVKTGYTDPAGRCLVAAARRNGVRLAAIVLDSPDPGGQAKKLLDRGFKVYKTS